MPLGVRVAVCPIKQIFHFGKVDMFLFRLTSYKVGTYELLEGCMVEENCDFNVDNCQSSRDERVVSLCQPDFVHLRLMHNDL